MKKFPKKRQRSFQSQLRCSFVVSHLLVYFCKKLPGMDDAWALKPKERERNN